jgi:homoserine O-acetyltransferase
MTDATAADARVQGRFRTGAFDLEAGGRSGGVEVAYWTLGQLNPAKDNAILLCHGATGGRDWALPFCRPGGAFDPARWFVISPDMPGGGDSSRVSTDPAFPAAFSTVDMASAMLALIKGLGISRLHAFSGQSMAGFIGLEMAARAPQSVGRLALWTGGWRTDGFGQAVIGGLGKVLALDDGPAGYEAAASIFMPLAMGRGLSAKMPAAQRDGMAMRMAQSWRAGWRTDELTARYNAVAGSDLGERYGGRDAIAAKVTCPILWLVTASDVLITPADLAGAETWWPNAQVQVIDSDWGHVAPAAPPGSPEFDVFDSRTAAFLSAP